MKHIKSLIETRLRNLEGIIKTTQYCVDNNLSSTAKEELDKHINERSELLQEKNKLFNLIIETKSY